MRCFALMLCVLVTGAVLSSRAAAQEPTSLTGLVSDEVGQPLGSAIVAIDAMNLGTLADERGRYLLIVPASRVRPGQSVQVTVSLIGRTSQTRTVTLQPGTMNLDFSLAPDPLNLEEIVVTGAGMTTQRARLGVSINSVRAEEIGRSQETNFVAALAGKAPNVEVTSSAGDPGTGAYIRIR